MNNYPAFGYVLARRLVRSIATYHMAKELIDIYKTSQSLSFHSGSTLSLSDLLSVSHKHTVLYTNSEECMCIHISVCVCFCLSVQHTSESIVAGAHAISVEMERTQENVVS